MEHCETCRSYKEKEPLDTERNHTVVGRCKKRAPVAGVGFPYVFPRDEACGDYRPDEEKV